MSGYVILLIVPVIIGILIAAGVVAISALRERLIDARLASLDATDAEDASSLADSPARDESADVNVTRRRIAS
jgi:hypothetical protein